MRYAFFLVIGLVFPMMVSAQIVPCDGPDCDWGAIIRLAQNILDIIITLSIVVAAGMFAYAGYLYFSDGGSTKKISQAHGIFSSVVIGLVIVLVAWLVINTLLDVLTGRGLDERSREINMHEDISLTLRP